MSASKVGQHNFEKTQNAVFTLACTSRVAHLIDDQHAADCSVQDGSGLLLTHTQRVANEVSWALDHQVALAQHPQVMQDLAVQLGDSGLACRPRHTWEAPISK